MPEFQEDVESIAIELDNIEIKNNLEEWKKGSNPETLEAISFLASRALEKDFTVQVVVRDPNPLPSGHPSIVKKDGKTTVTVVPSDNRLRANTEDYLLLSCQTTKGKVDQRKEKAGVGKVTIKVGDRQTALFGPKDVLSVVIRDPHYDNPIPLS